MKNKMGSQKGEFSLTQLKCIVASWFCEGKKIAKLFLTATFMVRLPSTIGLDITNYLYYIII